MKNIRYRQTKQCGMAVMIMSLILLFTTTIVTITAAKTAFIEQKTANNEIRTKRSFEAAEAGLEFGLAYLNSNKNAIQQDSNNDGFIDNYSNSNTANVVQTNGTSYTLTFSNPNVNDLNIIAIRSSGASADATTTQTVEETFANFTTVALPPRIPITVKDNINISGNISITNTITDITIWTGGTATLGGAANTVTSSGVSSTSGNIQADIVQNDATISTMTNDEFFQNTFQESRAQTQATADVVYTNNFNTNYSSDLDGVTNKMIWIEQIAGEARITSNTVMGSPSQPVILIVNGDFKVTGDLTLFGIVYVAQNWANSGGGTVSVTGAIIVEGDLSGAGTPNVTYDPNILRRAYNNFGTFSKIPGTWRDI